VKKSKKTNQEVKDWHFWKQFKVEGKYFNRIKFKSIDKSITTCNDCKCDEGDFHLIGCFQELCPHCKMNFVNCEAKYHGSDEE
jgi:hypothetical protein